VFHRRGQRYEIVDVHTHRTRDDRLIPLHRLRSNCAECGRAFEFSVKPSTIQRGQGLNRRCDLHRRPGVPVDVAARRRSRGGRSRKRRPEPRRAGLPSRREERRSA
jgi:hypothetical protein